MSESPRPFPAGRALRMVGVLGWTLFWFLAWAWNIYGVMQPLEDQVDADVAAMAQGCGFLVATGCCGGIWFVGVATAALIYSLLRR